MVVDVGGGTSEVAVISLGGIVVSRSLRVGGYDLDDTIAAWLRNTHRLAIGETTAERVKLEVGSVAPDDTNLSWGVRGRDPVSGLPREVDVTSEEIRTALEEPVAEIVAAVKEALETTPPELASDIFDRGIVVAGGGGLLRGFPERLAQETNVAVGLAEDPLTCVALGAGRALDEIELLETALVTSITWMRTAARAARTWRTARVVRRRRSWRPAVARGDRHRRPARRRAAPSGERDRAAVGARRHVREGRRHATIPSSRACEVAVYFQDYHRSSSKLGRFGKIVGIDPEDGEYLVMLDNFECLAVPMRRVEWRKVAT